MVPGNHDLPVGGDALWQSKFSFLPDSQIVDGKQGIDKMDYYFDKGDTRFVSVTTDSQANGAGGQPAALDWLEPYVDRRRDWQWTQISPFDTKSASLLYRRAGMRLDKAAYQRLGSMAIDPLTDLLWPSP